MVNIFFSFQVQCISLAYDNRRAVVGGADGRVYIFDLHSGLITRTINSHTQCVTGVRVTDKDDFLITAGWCFFSYNILILRRLSSSISSHFPVTGGTKITFWSFRQEENRVKKPTSARNHTGHITCLNVSRDGTIAATGKTSYFFRLIGFHEIDKIIN